MLFSWCLLRINVMFYNLFGLKSCKDTYFYYDNQSILPFVFFICNKKHPMPL